MDTNNKYFLDKYKKQDITQELVNFTSSPAFKDFEVIMENLYLSRLHAFHTEKEEKDILISQKVLNIYANLPELIKLMEAEAIENKKVQNQRVD